MKNSLKLTIFFIVFLPLLSFGQQRWETILGNPQVDDYPAEIITDYDGGYLITSLDILQQNTLYKTDKNGDLLWKKVFINNNGTYFNGVALTEKDGQKIVVGNIDNNAFLWSVNECGAVNWCSEFDDQNYISSLYTNIVILDDQIIVLGYLVPPDYNYICALFGFDYNGNLLWVKDILNAAMDTLLGNLLAPAYLDKCGNNYFVSGFCYYAYPDNPNLVYLKGMFIKVDSLFNKEWFLPYGMSDSLFAISTGVIPLDSLNYRGYGKYFLGYTDTLNSIFMDFDTAGNETGHIGISNNTISPEVKDNDLVSLMPMNDSTYMITAQVGTIPLTRNPIGEFTIDTGGTVVYQYQNHPGAYTNYLHPTVKTAADQFVFVAQKQNTKKDILLYKLNADLSQADYDTATYLYDSLCPDSITSDTIYLNHCDVITTVPEFPTPKAYQEARQKVYITAYPNPAAGRVNFKLKNTRFQSNMELYIYDISGKLLMRQNIVTGQKEAGFNIGGLPQGIHVAVIGIRQKVLGKTLFGVR